MSRSTICVCWLCPLVCLALAFLFVFLSAATPAAQESQTNESVSFINQIAPILKENCFACHDAKKRKGKLDMTTYGSFRKGGTKDDPVAPGSPEDSILLDVLKSTGADRMPPKEAGEPLPKEKIARIESWIKQGAKLDAGLNANADLSRELRMRWKPPRPPVRYTAPVNINAVLFSPDNKKLLVGGYHEITVWDIHQARLEKRLYLRSQRVHGMLFLPDGKLVVAGGRPGQEGDVRVYDLNLESATEADRVTLLDGVNDRKVLVKVLLDAEDSIFTLDLSKDGKKLAAGGFDRLVRVWDISDGIENAGLDQTIENHVDCVFSVAFSSDGKWLLTASRDKTVKIWDLNAKESLLTFPDHQQYAWGATLNNDGTVGLSVGEDGNLRSWRATDKDKQLGKQIRIYGKHDKAIFKMSLYRGPKNPVLATAGDDGTVKLWQPDKGTLLKTLTGQKGWVIALAISGNGELVASGTGEGEIRIWHTSDGSLVQAFNASPGYKGNGTDKK
jgi:WD40 repeat protein